MFKVSPRQTGVIILGGAHGSLAVARSLGRRGVPVCFVGSDNPLAQFSRYVQRHVRWDGPATASAVSDILALANDGMEGWLLFPSGDAEVRLLAQNYAALSERFRLFTMPWATLDILNNKSRLYALASTLGVDFPRVYEGAGRADLRFPVILKPTGSGPANAFTRAKAWRADSLEEFEAKAAEASALVGRNGFVVQELIPGDGQHQFSYAALWDRGREIISLTARRTRQYPIDFGLTSTFVETVERPEVAAAARRLLAGVRFHGLVEVEFKYDDRDERYKVLDVNTRAWAWIGISAASGVDFPYLAWLLGTGQALPAAFSRAPACWVHPSRNFLSIIQEIMWRGEISGAAVGSMFRPAAWATFAPDDLLPGLADFPIQVGRLVKRVRHRLGR